MNKVQIAFVLIFVILIGKNSINAQSPPIISSIDPNYAANAGSTLIIKGTAIIPDSFQARIGDTPLKIIKITRTKVIVRLPMQSMTGNLYVSNGTSATEYSFCNNYRVVSPQITSMELNGSASGSGIPSDDYKFSDEIKLTGKDLDFLVIGREIEGIGTAIKFVNVSGSSVNLTEIPLPTTVVNSRNVSPYPDNRYFYIGIDNPVINSDKTELTFTLGVMFEYKTPSNYIGSDGLLHSGASGRIIAGMETYYTYGVFFKKDQVNMNGQLAFRRWNPSGSGKSLPSPTHDEIVNFPIHTNTFTYSGLPTLRVARLNGREGYPWEISRPNMGTADNPPSLTDVKFWVEGEGFSTNTVDEDLKLLINEVEHPIKVDPGGKTASFILKQDAGTVNVKFVRGNTTVTHYIQPTDVVVSRRPVVIDTTRRPTDVAALHQPIPFEKIIHPTLDQSITATVIPTPWFPPNTNPTVTIGTEHTLVGNYLLPPNNISFLSYKVILDSRNYEANIIQHTNNMIRFTVIKSAGGSDHPGNYYLEIIAVYPNGVERVIGGVWVNVQN